MKISQIKIEDIQTIYFLIESNNYSCNRLIEIIDKNVTTQKINENESTIILNKVSENISTIVLGCEISRIKTITFYGNINVTPKELWNIFKKYREGYSIHDDLYFYFFNEDKESRNYILSFFDPSHKQVDIYNSNEHLSNITLTW
ncbi:hypothetical protein [Parafilimonas terrae]|uniref:Uncharacterized protein n=1 Tax=Parafilimonas terrae TaxID=1465490 RepID=A0A1I5T9R8_9BACT|nr:hypothetical protein [Parafilimonas terrae]SFP79718.1 hypothetical protein SAMN05444277_1023 [Parafilimonas terrae]